MIFRTIFAFFGLAAGVAVAQVPVTEAEMREERVQAILDLANVKVRAAREQIGPPVDETTRVIMYAAVEAIRADSEEKLATILSGAELARVRARLPQSPARYEPLRFRKV